jgi:hypothetical protein
VNTLVRRLLAPSLAAVLVALALLAPGALGASGSSQPEAQPASGATGPTGPTGPTTPPLGLVATLSACHTDPLTANRYAIFASQMTAIPGTRTMTVSFTLEERSATHPGTFLPVSAPGFETWVSSQPGVGIFTYNHEVTGLPAPAAFRVLVRARWVDRHRRVIRREMIVSAVCAQPLLQPDLAIGAPLSRAAGSTPGTVLYSVLVRNDGTAPAGPFQVALSVGGVALADVAVPGLAADSTQLVQFSGPRCPAGSTLVATADPAGAISEPANPDRTRSFPCLH